MMDYIDLIKKNFKISEYFKKEDLISDGEKRFKICCPFHKETVPSFFITEKPDGIEVFHCFGCKEGGTIFDFLKKKEKKTFIEIYEELSNKLGKQPNVKKKTIRNKTHINTLEKINDFFVSNLKKNKKAYKYLIHRGLEEKDINFFKLGYVNGVLNFINKNNLNLEICNDLHMIKKDSSSSYYDILYDRITIPLFLQEGMITGISSRTISDNAVKYMNPKDSSMFKKNSFLYGLNWSKNYIKNENGVILVEGYFDFMSMYKHNIKNVVALMGTALMSNHVKMLSKLTENFYFFFDGDTTGKASIIKNLKEPIKQGVKIYVLELPDNSDPDDFFRKSGTDEFSKMFKNSIPIIDYISKMEEDTMIPVLEDLKLYIQKIPSTIKKEFWKKNILNKIGIDLGKDIRKEYFLREKDIELTYNDIMFLKFFINADNEEIKNFLNKNRFFETKKAKLLYLKLKNDLYNISLTKEEEEIVLPLKLEKKSSIDKVKKFMKILKEEKLLKNG